MTPAVNSAKRAKISFEIHEYEHDPASNSYGEEASTKLGVDADRVFKTLVVDLGGSLAVAIVPVSTQLDLKALAKVLGSKKAAMADKSRVEKVTGYVLGGVSPLGQKKSLPTVLDSSARQFSTLFVSAGRRGLEIELSPTDLQQLTRATLAEIGKSCD